jgi:mono/diheme cytochrome c family protein
VLSLKATNFLFNSKIIGQLQGISWHAIWIRTCKRAELKIVGEKYAVNHSLLNSTFPSLIPKENHVMASYHRIKNLEILLWGFLIFVLTHSLGWAGNPGDLKPRIPPERLEEAQSFQSPFSPSADIVAAGKKLYEGKALCSACHGLEGAGGTSDILTLHDGQPPTNFADAAWQAARTDGEMFWILKHGSHGTDMAPYMPLYLTEDQAWQIVTYIRMFGGT